MLHEQLSWREINRNNTIFFTSIIPQTRVRILKTNQFLSLDIYQKLLEELKELKWEQNYSSYIGSFRKPIKHLQKCFTFEDELEAYVTNYEEEKEGQVCGHFFEKWNGFQNNSLGQLKEKVQVASGNINCVEILLYRPASTNCVSKKGEELSIHTDGPQLKTKSSIGGFVAGVTSNLIVYTNSFQYSLETSGNSLYILEPLVLSTLNDEERKEWKLWWKEEEKKTYPLPWNLKHSRESRVYLSNEFQIVCVFRNLQHWKDEKKILTNRWNKEKKTPFNLNWNCPGESTWNYQQTVGIIYKPKENFQQYVLQVVNNWKDLILVEIWEKTYGPGEEYHKNPLVTALLGIHYVFSAGKAIAGNSQIGICSIRCGPEDIIINSYYVIFWTGETDENLNASIISYTKQNIIRVLLGSNVFYAGKKYLDSQYYFGNMFLHEIKKDNNKWKWTLRGWPKSNDIDTKDYCSCCSFFFKQ